MIYSVTNENNVNYGRKIWILLMKTDMLHSLIYWVLKIWYYDQCTPVSAADAKAGNIIFFTGTYNAGRPVTHVGIYCGNGTMVHCGDPIQYMSINTSYWQSHFYGFCNIKR